MKKFLFLVLLGALTIPAANADTFDLNSFTVSLRSTDPGLVLHWSPDLSTPHSFNLDPGEHTSWFSLFDLWTDETTVNADDETPYPISVTFNFAQPLVSATVGGETDGINLLWGIVQSGHVAWNGPAVVPFGDGGQFSIYLEDAYFNTGLFGLWESPTDIFARINYDKAPGPSEVPEPCSLLLLGGGFLLLGGGFGRKKIA